MRRVLSYGGGLDSFAMLVESCRRGEKPDIAAFVDVGAPGDPGEWPSTYRHIEEVVKPFCEREGIEFVTIGHELYPVRDARSLFRWLWDRQQIPVAGPNRICTIVAKVERFEAWLDGRFPNKAVEVWVGFDAAEQSRVENDPNAGGTRKLRAGMAMRVNRFPLVEWGLCRCRCEALVRGSGFPVPRKSACVFCPYGTKRDWQRLAEELPETFDLIVEMERRKPLTIKNRRKLTIMAYDSRKQEGVPLDRWVKTSYRPKKQGCSVCGAAQRATKATGCDYLAEAA